MYSTTAYIFQQRTQVLLLDSSGQYFTARYDSVYAKRLTLNLGVDNVMLFAFVNQDEKPVNVTGCTFVFNLLNLDGTAALYQTYMTILNASAGYVKVYIPAADTWQLTAQPANYSITVSSGNLTQAVFTNAQSGARAPIDIVNSVQPKFVPSVNLTIPTINLPAQASFDGTGFENWPGFYSDNPNGQWYYNTYVNTVVYSSFIEPVSSVTTVQMDLINYTGTIKAQWAETYQSIWYNLTETRTYFNATETIYMNLVGWYPLMRMAFNNSIFSTPMQPSIPASAYVTVNNGVVTAITI